MRDGSNQDDPAPEAQAKAKGEAAEPVVPIKTGRATRKSRAEIPMPPPKPMRLNASMLKEPSAETYRPVIFEDIGKAGSSSCSCFGKGFDTYLRGKSKADRKAEKKACPRCLRKFLMKHGDKVFKHEGAMVWKPGATASSPARTIPPQNPLRKVLQPAQ